MSAFKVDNKADQRKDNVWNHKLFLGCPVIGVSQGDEFILC